MDLSSPVESRLPRTWIALLRGRIRASLAATTGVAGSEDVVKYLLAGADVVMSASALPRHGSAYALELISGLEDWMARKGYTSPDQFRGLLAVPADMHEADIERAGYVATVQHGKQTYGDW
jgi:dihydroorotate dehydrogenase (fumarate)